MGQIKLTSTQSVLQKTKLGWILVGPLSVPIQRLAQDQRRVCHLITTQQLSEQVAKFWEIEECPAQISKRLSQDEQFCESYFGTRQSETRKVDL